MKFGVREICDVVFKAKSDVKIGNRTFKKGQPVLYIDSAKTSTVESAATTVYATGGKGNTRLIAWEGEKTLTFTVEDALLSPIGFAVLSGAGLFKGTEAEKVHVHSTSVAYTSTNEIDLTDALAVNEKICASAPIFVAIAEADGSITGDIIENLLVDETGKKLVGNIASNQTVFVDYYVQKTANKVDELQIDAGNFAGYYYVEASTLFRRESNGVDMPAELTLPNVKIQSNFTFTMASSGDPSTFTFTMDAFPGYTYFNPTKKVLCAIQIIDDEAAEKEEVTSVFPEIEYENIPESENDSVVVKAVVPAQTSTILNKLVSEMIAPGASVSTNGFVNATMQKVTGFTDFSSIPGEENGYYMPFNLDVQGPRPDVMTFAKKVVANGGAYVETKKNIDFDPELILRIADENKTQKIYDFKVTLGYRDINEPANDAKIVNKGAIEIHFDKVKFA